MGKYFGTDGFRGEAGITHASFGVDGSDEFYECAFVRQDVGTGSPQELFLKKFAGIFPSGLRDCFGVLTSAIDTVVNQRVCRNGDHCGLAFKTADGLRSHIRAIRLEQNSIEWGCRKCLAHVFVALKSGRTTIGDIASSSTIPMLYSSIGKTTVNFPTSL